MLVSPVMHLKGLRHIFLTVLLLFLSKGTYHLQDISPIFTYHLQYSLRSPPRLIYLLPIFNIISKFPLIPVHPYAYDIQFNVTCTSDINFAPNLMSNCIKSIHNWLSNMHISSHTFSQTPINSPTFYHG